jgi:hypothetical protein
MISAQYLGMPLEINDLDHENLNYFAYCAKHDFRLQRCASCKLLRYPPTTACPWCSELIRNGCRSRVAAPCIPTPKSIMPFNLLSSSTRLSRVAGRTGHPERRADQGRGLRVIGNLVRPDGVLAPKAEVERVGIGTRVRMVFTDVAPGLALPQWTIDETAAGGTPWRYRG